MPNLDPGMNQNNSIKNEAHMVTNTTTKFENHLLSIKSEHQERINLNHILPIMNVIKKL